MSAQKSYRALLTTERGSTTILSALICAALIALGIGSYYLIAPLIFASKSQSAADMAALGGASAIWSGKNPCQIAQDIAHKNNSTLLSCEVLLPDVQVKVQYRGQKSSARAGPLSAQ